MQLEELAAIGVVTVFGDEPNDEDDDAIRRTARPWTLAGATARVIGGTFMTYREEVARSVECIHTSPHTVS